MELASRKVTSPATESDSLDSPPNVGDEALYAGLSIILADAAKCHLKAGNLDKASLCLQEAERYIATSTGI